MEKRAFTCFFALAIFFKFTCCYDTKKYPLIMPNVKQNKSELYLCTSIRVRTIRNYYIIGFEPNTTMATHHMVVFGCTKPGSSKLVWECEQMLNSNNKADTSSPCAKGAQVIYGWDKNAPKLNLPEGVGFKIGGYSPIQYIVLQVHYARVADFKDGTTDNSGVFLHYTTQRMDKLAGVIALTSNSYISTRKTKSTCLIRESKTIYPFAFKTHTYSHGTIVSGYVMKPNNDWIELGKRDPLKPQMFFPVPHKILITYGDTLTVRCVTKSTHNGTTYIGNANQDEMCYFFLMYYVDKGSLLKLKFCFSPSPPLDY
ncbi:PREDICTED: peptidylglycine alpha-hydroxylating monooxygenase-like [Wasmannia auropunctata]|uniref:peptidylglycine alpha-hydroxylating monooxygenase-like n=1 Tax=Wasmannia auropunctata TaxID=64793 RepID=UPI0005EEEC3E|nr:PREDICTED: peptidylglycine alpha-hydroxylating monooxygenase-like [Wasmannia auropunctata]